MAKPTPGTVCRTLTDAYQRFGITIANPRTAWSAQADDGTVVLSLWANVFADPERRVYENYDVPITSWTGLWQNRRRIEHLQYAQRHRDGLFESNHHLSGR